MHILAFETTGKNASVAVIGEDGGLALEKSEGEMNHLQSLIPMTELLMKNAGLTLKDITYIAVSAGPGSFTGIRIGVSTARALSQAMNIQCISVPSLPAFIYNMGEHTGMACPVLDARRGQVYAGAFYWEGHEIQEAVSGGAYIYDEYMELVKKSSDKTGVRELRFFGDGDQTASSIARLALELYRRGNLTGYGDLKPIYMRKAEAERKLLHIRRADKKDVKSMTSMDEVCFSVPWSEQSFFEEITANKLARYIIAEIDGKMTGYAGLWIILDEGHITNVAVHPDYRRKGIAKALISSLIESSKAEGARLYTLEVRASNIAAISLYKSLDFKISGIRKEYYEDNNEDAIIMWRN